MRFRNARVLANVAAMSSAVLFAFVTLHAGPSRADAVGLRKLYDDPVLLASMVPNVRASSTGALGANRAYESGKLRQIFIDDQLAAATLVIVGEHKGQVALEDEGWRGIRWGFDHLNGDCSFQGGDEVHASSMFLEAAARAILVGRAPPNLDSNGIERGMKCAATRLAARDIDRDPELLRQAELSHRYFIKASALYAVGTVTNDDRLEARAVDYVAKALRAQQSDGLSPERGGADVGYQAAGIVYATRFYALCDDSSLKEKVRAFISKGLDWLASRIGPDGSVDATGSTRVLVEKGRTGKLKQIPYGVVAEAFAGGAEITNRADFRSLAVRIEHSAAFQEHFAR